VTREIPIVDSRMARETRPPAILGISPEIITIRRRIKKLASGREPILIIGEAGVGKSLIAQHIHRLSPFKQSTLRSFNASVLPERAQRIELFGAEPPELTSSRRGILELETTVLIKHIDHAPAYIQEALAEALAHGRTRRFGASDTRPVCSRIIMTLRREAGSLSEEKRMVPCLSEQLAKCEAVIVPSLKHRPEDALAMAREYLREKGDDMDRKHLEQTLDDPGWEENISDLKAYLRIMAITSHEEAKRRYEFVQLEKMLMMMEEGKEFSLKAYLSLLENAMIERALNRTNGHQARAARLLGLTDRTIRRAIDRLR
jgi:Nif-specific regulatory protein